MRRFRSFASIPALFLAFSGHADPSPHEASRLGVGRRVPDLAFVDAAGNAGTLSQIAGEKGTVIAIHRLNCPLSMKFSPALARAIKEHSPRGFGFLLVNGLASATPQQALAAAEKYGLSARYAMDADRAIQSRLGALTSTEIFVLDAARTVVFRGPLSDQYGLTHSLPEPKRRFLDEALEAVLAGRDPETTAAPAPGCALGVTPAPESLGEVTFHNRVSRILQRHCQDCHRSGGVAPFPLVTYDEAMDFKSMMAEVIRGKLMPPWFASPAHGKWGNDRSLASDDERALLHWLDGEGVEGDPADAPLPRRWPESWAIGTPDLVIESPQSFTVPAEGVMPYQYTIVKNPLDRDVWVEAVEIRNTSPSVVHHVLVLLRKPGDREDPSGLTGFFAALVPGQSTVRFKKGLARKLPKGMELVFQLHYTPNGKEATDRASLGVVFAKEEPRFEVSAGSAYNAVFQIPPHAPNHEVRAQHTFKEATRLLAFMPHMHLRGKAFRYELEIPGRGRETLLDVPRYDFNWQLRYELAEPRDVPAGAVLHATAWYDNSDKNPWNPDPTATVGFGEQTFEEMMIGYYESHPLP